MNFDDLPPQHQQLAQDLAANPISTEQAIEHIRRSYTPARRTYYELLLSCGHTVSVMQPPPALTDGWYAATHCGLCRRKRSVTTISPPPPSDRTQHGLHP